MKLLILVLFTVGLLGLLLYTPVYAESLGLIEIKKWRVINSPEVCGDKLCKELEGDSGISPLKQFNEGISLEKIRCKQGFELVLKTSNNHPACVKESSIDILVQRGWATVLDIIIKQHIPVDAESAEKARQISIKGVVLATESFVMDENNPSVIITSSDINGQDAIIFEGSRFRGFHVIDIIVTNDFGFEAELKTKTGMQGTLYMPWLLYEPLGPGTYNVEFSDRVSSHEITIKIGNIQKEKTKLRLSDITTSSFNGGQPIVFSGNLFTESGKIIADAEILIIGDGPCPSDGIIAKGQTDKRGRYRIMVETMIWDPTDNLIKIHAEYFGDEFYEPSYSQDEVIVVYPNKYTKSCLEN
ncbi:MAG: hypothetical protein IH792_06285 [Thaumarchaeota archaeon]|nr:hypothetical protein [Nitrososphaerota archaeon]